MRPNPRLVIRIVLPSLSFCGVVTTFKEGASVLRGDVTSWGVFQGPEPRLK